MRWIYRTCGCAVRHHWSPVVPHISNPWCLCFHHGPNLRVSPRLRLRVKASVSPGRSKPPTSTERMLGCQTRLSMYVTTCSVTFQLRPQTVPDSEQGFTFTECTNYCSVFVPGRSRTVQKLNNNSHTKCKSKSPKTTRLPQSGVRRQLYVLHLI